MITNLCKTPNGTVVSSYQFATGRVDADRTAVRDRVLTVPIVRWGLVASMTSFSQWEAAA